MNTFANDNSLFFSEQMGSTIVIEFRKAAFNLLKDVALANEYIQLIEAAEDDSTINGIVLINDKQFDEAAGIQALINNSGSIKAIATFRNIIERLFLLYLTISKPVVAGVHGHITSEYLGIILPYDARIATVDSSINFTTTRLGLPPSPGLTFFLPRFIGQGKALSLIQQSQTLTADDAMNLGLVTNVVTYEQLKNHCLNTVEQLSAFPAGAAASSRILINPTESELEGHIERYIKALTLAMSRL